MTCVFIFFVKAARRVDVDVDVGSSGISEDSCWLPLMPPPGGRK